MLWSLSALCEGTEGLEAKTLCEAVSCQVATFELSTRTISLLKKDRKKARAERTKRQINKKKKVGV